LKILPIRLRFLLVSAWLIVILTMLHLGIAAWSLIGWRARNPAINYSMLLGMFAFLFHSYVLILVLKKYYPAREITNNWRIPFFMATAIAFVYLVSSIYKLANIFSSPVGRQVFINMNSSLIGAATILILALSFLLQIYNSIEGIRLMISVKKNARQNLIDSFQ
jgi:hypothetical protein